MPDAVQHAKEIRAALKAAKITARQVSVVSDTYSMGSSVRVCIRDLAVSYAVVKAAADGHEKVRRDEQGEILGGGNMFVDVRVDSDAVNAIADALVPDDQGLYRFAGYAIHALAEGGFYVPEIHGRQCDYLSSAVLRIYCEGTSLADRILDKAGPTDMDCLVMFLDPSELQ